MTVTRLPAATQIAAPANELDRRAAALADVVRMNDDLTDAHATIGQLKADLHREQDRCVMISEERDRYRHQALTLRKLLVELATQQSNIGLLTVKAQEVVKAIDALDDAPTPPTAAIDKLEKLSKEAGL